MRQIALLLLSFLLFSCSEEQFELYSLSAELDRDIEISEKREEKNTLFITAEFSESDSIYTFRLTSPDGDLSWEGVFTGDGNEKSSEELSITDNALFPSGEYSVLIYSDKGTELEETFTLSYDSDLRFFSDGVLSGNAEITELDSDGNTIAEGERAEGYTISQNARSAIISYRDGAGNSVTVTQFFQPSA